MASQIDTVARQVCRDRSLDADELVDSLAERIRRWRLESYRIHERHNTHAMREWLAVSVLVCAIVFFVAWLGGV